MAWGAKPMSGVHVYTSFTYAYLARALTLARTLRAHHPDWTLWAVLVDRAPPDFDASWRDAFDVVLDAATLYGKDWPAFVFKHDVVEACTAVKARAALHLFDEGAEKIIYLDPDIALFGELSEAERRLEAASVLLTPHQIAPNQTAESFADNEAISMRYGIYNLGFLGLRNDATGRAVARWWACRLDAACFDDVANGVFTDQKYFDLAPALFDRVDIWRDPGCNVASWNLSLRALTIGADGRILVDGAHPLKFYHFSKAFGDGEVMTERYAQDNLAVYEIWSAYKRWLAAADAPVVTPKYWAYATYADGTPITKAARVFYRSAPAFSKAFEDPFAVGEGTYRDYLLNERPDLI